MIFCHYCSAQIDSTAYMGCWETLDPISIETINDKTVTSRLVYGHERSKIIFLTNNEAVKIHSEGQESRFTWHVKDQTIGIKEDEECPYFDYYYPRLASSDTCDTLYLEKHYKNPNYKTSEVWVRKKISVVESLEPINVSVGKKDYYYSYNKRIIQDQKPFIWKGHLDKYGILNIDSAVYGYAIGMTVSDQVEWHVIDNPNGGFDKVKVFIVTYDSQTKNISNVSYVYEYIKTLIRDK